MCMGHGSGERELHMLHKLGLEGCRDMTWACCGAGMQGWAYGTDWADSSGLIWLLAVVRLPRRPLRAAGMGSGALVGRCAMHA